MQIDGLVEEIVKQVMKRLCLQSEKALVIIPRLHMDVADGLVRLIGTKAYRQAIDVLLPKAMPKEVISVFETQGLYVDCQITSKELLNMDNYSEVFVIDLNASLMREVTDIRPYTEPGYALIWALEQNKSIQVLSCGFDFERIFKKSTGFKKELAQDVSKLKTWGVLFNQNQRALSYIPGRLVTASDLVGYEQKEVCIDPGAILTDLAREKAQKNGITIVR